LAELINVTLIIANNVMIATKIQSTLSSQCLLGC